jgi:uncharacterized membrane protein
MIEETYEAGPPINRMIIAVLALIGVLISVYLTLHKFGVIGTLVCGTGSCEVVQTSKYAVVFGIPVPLLGLIGYAIILVVAMVGLQSDKRAVSIALFLLADAAVIFTLYLTYLEAYVIHAWCRWCLASAAITILIWFFALAELPRLRRRIA